MRVTLTAHPAEPTSYGGVSVRYGGDGVYRDVEARNPTQLREQMIRFATEISATGQLTSPLVAVGKIQPRGERAFAGFKTVPTYYHPTR